MMKWPFKVFSEDPILQGLLRTRTTALYHPGRGKEKRAKENVRDSKKKGEDSKTKMQKSYMGWDEQRNPHREKETRNESEPTIKKETKKQKTKETFTVN